MAALPINIKDMLDAFGDIDAARTKPVTVAVLLDASAPADLLDFARSCFSSTEANARVAVSYYDQAKPPLPYGCDLAVLVAGFSEETGPLAQAIRSDGKPVLVVTSMPGIVSELAQATGAPLLEKDLLAPPARQGSSAGLAKEGQNAEPIFLDTACEASLRDAMGAWIVEVFNDKKLAFALCFPFVRKPLALDAVKATSAQNAAVGAVVLIPGADMPVMTANQAKMILQIAAAYGQKMGMERARELVGVIAGAFALRTAARQVVGVVPGLGWAIKGAIGYSGTFAMGHAAIAYFESLAGQKKSPADIAATSPADLAKNMLNALSEKTGMSPAEWGKQVLSSVLSNRANK